MYELALSNNYSLTYHIYAKTIYFKTWIIRIKLFVSWFKKLFYTPVARHVYHCVLAVLIIVIMDTLMNNKYYCLSPTDYDIKTMKTLNNHNYIACLQIHSTLLYEEWFLSNYRNVGSTNRRTNGLTESRINGPSEHRVVWLKLRPRFKCVNYFLCHYNLTV
jgi:hypothetical protein